MSESLRPVALSRNEEGDYSPSSESESEEESVVSTEEALSSEG